MVRLQVVSGCPKTTVLFRQGPIEKPIITLPSLARENPPFDFFFFRIAKRLDQIGSGSSIALCYARFDLRVNGMPHAGKLIFNRVVVVFMVRIISELERPR